MRAGVALVVVDTQVDYLGRAGLQPSADHFTTALADLLRLFRDAGAPVAHVRTLVRADGSDAMPHWRSRDVMPCVAGTPGAEPPQGLGERPGECVAIKQHYDGFADGQLDAWLRDRGVGTVVVAGLYTHACVRETAVRAYELGYEVVIARDAVASDDPEHAAATLRWLEGRAASVVGTEGVVRLLDGSGAPTAVHLAAEEVSAAQRNWSQRPARERAELVERWADALDRRADEAVDLLVAEVMKPRVAAEDEVRRAVGHLRAGARLVRDGLADDRTVAEGVVVRRRPVGVVAALMPWNNPLALPCGVIGPALALGNAVVLKPAPEAGRCAEFLRATMAEADLPPDLVRVVQGSADVGQALVTAPWVDAVVVTGSIATGRSVAAHCARLGRPLRAELGGNNAAIVLADADLEADVPALVRGAFSYSGQRCTAVRRLVVQREVLDRVLALTVAEAESLVIGDPDSRDTVVGPLISVAARDRVAAAVRRAVDGGAVLLAGGEIPDVGVSGAWYAPTVLLCEDRDSAVVQEETFGPVLVVQPADDVDDAIAAANGVRQGLLMAVCTRDADARATVVARAEAGILQMGARPAAIHPDAPFGGWKASGYGPPEHGVWDVEFLTRAQAVYES